MDGLYTYCSTHIHREKFQCLYLTTQGHREIRITDLSKGGSSSTSEERERERERGGEKGERERERKREREKGEREANKP